MFPQGAMQFAMPQQMPMQQMPMQQMPMQQMPMQQMPMQQMPLRFQQAMPAMPQSMPQSPQQPQMAMPQPYPQQPYPQQPPVAMQAPQERPDLPDRRPQAQWQPSSDHKPRRPFADQKPAQALQPEATPIFRGYAPEQQAPLTLPRPDQLGIGLGAAPTASTAPTASQELDWNQAHQRLRELGAVSFQMQQQPRGGYCFTVELPGQKTLHGHGLTETQAVAQALSRVQEVAK